MLEQEPGTEKRRSFTIEAGLALEKLIDQTVAQNKELI